MKNHKPKQTKLPLAEFQKAWETKGVFSEHYIKSRLNKSSVWPKEEEARPIWEFCRKLWNKSFLKLARANESVTRQEFLDKVLDKLGFAFLPNTPLPITERGKEPDYILFADEATKDSVMGKSKMEQYRKAIALLEAKKVHHPLGAVSRRETPGRFPHQQVRDYLQEATDESGKAFFNWAILTNGGQWRLYCRDAHPSSYFEFNLEESIESFKDFMLFFALFRRDALIPDSEGLCPLDYLRKEALQYQTELEDDLKKRVFNILVSLANGFYQKHKIESLDELYENCLIFLYRLLFVLYAEGGGLLPVRPYGAGSRKHYKERYSLQRLIPRLKNRPDSFSKELTDLYEELLGLFHLINGDQPSRNRACDVSRYNGGLFDPKKYPKIEKWRVDEKTLAEVLTGLMFSPIPVGRGEQRKFNYGETIDYADLQVRQLGSIYEGLLENHLELEKGHLVLRGDKTRRKETGTYYTPDYIVDYIVRNTVKPLCHSINEIPKVKNAIKNEIKDNSFAREVLKLKILDPAMGSGHFLVRATEFLADQIVNHPTTEIQTESVSQTPREEIISMDKVPVAKGLSHEEAEIAYWRRRVVESCIYGVDLNPLAVELAKLSLWLTCIATDQPLSFLDHHFRPGNSLIGAKLAELGTHPRKKATKVAPIPFGPDLPKAVSEAIRALKKIEETESKDVSTIKDKESCWLTEVRERLKPYRTIADLWTSTFFGSKIDGPTYQNLAKLLIENASSRTKEARTLQKRIKPFATFLNDARKRYFFHWELEFPEIFFNEDGAPKKNAGFDAVIGNPPYIRFHSLNKDEISYFLVNYNFAKGQFDAFAVMIERSISILRSKGYFGFIISDLFLRGLQYEEIRKMLLKVTRLSNIVELGDSVFPASRIPTCILLYTKDKPNDNSVVFQVGVPKRIELCKLRQKVLSEIPGVPFDSKAVRLLPKVLKDAFYLGEICYISRGIEIGKDKLSDRRFHLSNVPVLSGDEIQRFISGSPKFIDRETAKLFAKQAKIFAPPKIVVRETGGNIAACYDEEGILTLRTLHNIHITHENLDGKYVLALLNSRLMQRIFELCFRQAGDVFPKIRIAQERLFPIRRVFFSMTDDERKKSVEKLKTMVETEEFEQILSIVEECLPKDAKGNFITEKERSDVVHDFLVFLAEKMIEMNKEKQNLIREFLEWLESEVIKGSVDSLKNKTKIKEFYNYDFGIFTDVLRQNRILPKVIEFGNEQYKILKEAYDKTVIKLHPLISKINDTDNLIDQIVYKLYWLTKEEIRAIED